jgi:hypothetical protein
MMIFSKSCSIPLFLTSLLFNTAYANDSITDLEKRLDDLESANKQLLLRVEKFETNEQKNKASLLTNHSFSGEILDPTTAITGKQEFILKQKLSGSIATNSVYLGGAITAIANYQISNTDSKFGYLMRHPTSTNQRTSVVSEAAIHSSQLYTLANLNSWMTGYMELLYDPEQSFGSGTNTALARNQIQLRQGYILFGDLNASPFYASLGKMASPFGLTDTVNPFTASTVWHAFGQLAYGGKVGFLKDGLSVRGMAIQSGPQFRGANVPVESGSTATSSLNNYAFDLSYTLSTSTDSQLMLGSSYTKGTAYCQEFPVAHFGACNNENGAYDLYAQWKSNNWTVQAEFVKTMQVWNGTFNPALPQYPASKVTSWGIGTQYRSLINSIPVDYSAEFSKYIAGPDDSPWASQDQWVLGMAARYTTSSKLFIELIRTRGYVPLNFLSGGNTGSPGVGAEGTWSDQNVISNILMVGANLAF